MVNLLNDIKRRCVCAKRLDTPYDFGARSHDDLPAAGGDSMTYTLRTNLINHVDDSKTWA